VWLVWVVRDDQNNDSPCSIYFCVHALGVLVCMRQQLGRMYILRKWWIFSVSVGCDEDDANHLVESLFHGKKWL
jgi:hypothetical protein